MVHIREYKTANEQTFPTKKGISFTKVRWAKFRGQIDEIDRKVELLKANQHVDYSHHMGAKYYVTVSTGVKCVNFRRYFMPKNSDKERPTRSGIALRLGEWETLVSKIDELHSQLPELKVASPCYSSLDHLNQTGYLNCRECSPFSAELGIQVTV